MSEAGKRLLDLPNCRPETHARHGGDHSMLCFIGAVPGLITMKEWERLDREREIAEAVAAHEATLRERGWMDEWEVETATAMNYGDGQAAERARIVAGVKAEAGPLCVCPDEEMPVCETHSELCFDGHCEDFPTWLPAVLRIIEGGSE